MGRLVVKDQITHPAWAGDEKSPGVGRAVFLTELIIRGVSSVLIPHTPPMTIKPSWMGHPEAAK